MQEISLKESITQHINQAIELFFEEKNEIAAHTLALAALESLNVAGNKHQIYSIIKHPNIATSKIFNIESLEREYLRLVKTGRATKKQRNATEMWDSIVNVVYTFSKHGGHKGDMNSKVSFEKGINELILFDAIEIYRQICIDMTIEMLLFDIWFINHNNELLTHGDPTLEKLKVVAINLNLNTDNKLTYLKKIRLLQGSNLKSLSEMQKALHNSSNFSQ